MEHFIINKTWSFALSACLSDGWKIDSRRASSDVGKGSKLGPIPFSAAPAPCCLFSSPGAFFFPLPQPPFLSISSQSHDISLSFSPSLPIITAAFHSLSTSLPSLWSQFCSFLSWPGSLSLSLGTCLCFSLSLFSFTASSFPPFSGVPSFF